MIYTLLRWVAGIALHWFYREIRVVGAAKIPKRAPIIIAVNHPNALVDSLIPAWIVPRRITLTAKATLFEHRATAFLFKLLGIVPLRRAQDELARRREDTFEIDRSRNHQSFSQIIDVLKKNGAILIFPEGKSHSDPKLAPLKTGLARIALQARDDHKIRDLYIIPIGLSFEDKGTPGSSVVAEVGDVLNMEEWRDHSIDTLTEEVYKRLRDVSLSSVPRTPTYSQTKNPIARVFAWWGGVTHRIPLEMARNRALRISHNPDEPAMYTILYGIWFVIAAYLIQVAVLQLLFGWWVALLYGLTLPAGAYWAAYARR
jgi:1-acyl-sn-glycerol-3-phosphate acyltransferase